jgi:hypothetical protein
VTRGLFLKAVASVLNDVPFEGVRIAPEDQPKGSLIVKVEMNANN